MFGLFLYVFLPILIITSISAWIVAYRMRRKIGKTLGGNASKANITSLNTWIAVDEAEQRKKENAP